MDEKDEIEITPAMIEAGMEAYSLFSSEDRGHYVVDAIYRAMEGARNRPREDQAA